MKSPSETQAFNVASKDLLAIADHMEMMRRIGAPRDTINRVREIAAMLALPVPAASTTRLSGGNHYCLNPDCGHMVDLSVGHCLRCHRPFASPAAPTKDWCLNMAERERNDGDPEIGAGKLADFPAAPQPQAWKLVPVEPTREMWAAAGDAVQNNPDMRGRINVHHDIVSETVYRAMLAAAPAAPQAEGLVELIDALELAAMSDAKSAITDWSFLTAPVAKANLLAALTAAAATEAKLREALRKEVIHQPTKELNLGCCNLCGEAWAKEKPEQHASDCLAALQERE